MTVPIRPNLSCEVDGPDYTYVASISGLNVGVAATTDIFTLYGSATNIIRILQIFVSATIATAAAHFDVSVLTRSALPTGGTTSALNIGNQDSADPATTATNAFGYTVAPVAGALLGNQGTQKLYVPIPGANLSNSIQFNYGYGAGAKALILRGVNQGMAINLGGATPANASSWDIFVVYSERPAALSNF